MDPAQQDRPRDTGQVEVGRGCRGGPLASAAPPSAGLQALLDRDGGHDPAGDRSAKDQPGVASSTSASRRYDTDEQMPLAP